MDSILYPLRWLSSSAIHFGWKPSQVLVADLHTSVDTYLVTLNGYRALNISQLQSLLSFDLSTILLGLPYSSEGVINLCNHSKSLLCWTQYLILQWMSFYRPAITPSLLCNGRYLGSCFSLTSVYNFTSSVTIACSFHLENLLKVEAGIKVYLSIPTSNFFLLGQSTAFLKLVSLHLLLWAWHYFYSLVSIHTVLCCPSFQQMGSFWTSLLGSSG